MKAFRVLFSPCQYHRRSPSKQFNQKQQKKISFPKRKNIWNFILGFCCAQQFPERRIMLIILFRSISFRWKTKTTTTTNPVADFFPVDVVVRFLYFFNKQITLKWIKKSAGTIFARSIGTDFYRFCYVCRILKQQMWGFSPNVKPARSCSPAFSWTEG